MSVTIFLLWLVSIPFTIINANDVIPQPRGFMVNCGATVDIEEGSLKYMRDEGFIYVGNQTRLKQPDLLPILSTLRYFPEISARKYCYVFPVIKGGKFLVRTTYYYGGFDGGKVPPVFDQIIDGTKWSRVNTREDYENGMSSYYEIIVTAHSKTLSVCLARNEDTISSPFISALELQFLDGFLYNDTDFEKYALRTIARHSFGSGANIISFPDDQFNRFWQPFKDNNPFVTSHSNVTTSEFWNIPPNQAFSTAITTSKGKPLKLKWPPFSLPSSHYYIILYFQDNRTPSPYSWRVFSVSLNDETFYTNLNVTTSGVAVYGSRRWLSGQTEIIMTPQKDMPVGPVINAGEMFEIIPLGGRTLTRDVIAMEDLSRSFDNPPPDWYGDPCLPKHNSWSGVTCSEEGMNHRVVSLNLTSFKLSGSLSKSIANLTALSNLWIGNNQLSGTIPDMTPLKVLQSLNLEGNQFEGPIPKSLGQLPKLHEIFLQNNNLNGSIPQTLKKRNLTNFQFSPGNNLLVRGN